MSLCARGAAGCALICAIAVWVPTAATASFPGQNGPIAYAGVFDGPADILVIDPDEGVSQEPFNVTDTASPINETQPAFSPTGERIAFRLGDGNSNFEIFTIPAGGGTPVQLTETPEDYTLSNPAYTLNGAHVLYDGFFPHTPGDPFSGRGEIFMARTEAPFVEYQLTDTRYHDEQQPDANPDGNRVAYVRNTCFVNDDPPPNFNCSGREIWVATLSGTALVSATQLTDLPATQTSFPQAASPSWSPDGTKIVYTVDDVNSQQDVWIMDADGSNQMRITNTTASGFDENGPVWSPDGTQLLYYVNNELAVQAPTPNAPITYVTSTPGSLTPFDATWAPEQLVDIQTTITRQPPPILERRTAVFRYRATPSFGTTFECKLNRARFELCNNGRQKYAGLANGNYRFQVRGSDGSRFDPTPAKASFRVRVPRGQGR
jgi:Tol biopolymer transport system component